MLCIHYLQMNFCLINYFFSPHIVFQFVQNSNINNNMNNDQKELFLKSFVICQYLMILISSYANYLYF